MSSPSFPSARSLADALPLLRAPFAPGQVNWKIQRVLAGGRAAQIVGYLEVRAVYDRLNQVVGPDWETAFELIETVRTPTGEDGSSGGTLYRVRCRLRIDGVHREDVGEGEDPKAAFSDAAKRAAVHFGIGVSVYALPEIVRPVGSGDGELRLVRGRPALDNRVRDWLTRAYAHWLTGPGRDFGPALAAGPGVTGEEDPRADAGGEPPAEPEPLTEQDHAAAAAPRALVYSPETITMLAELMHGQKPGELEGTARLALSSVLASARAGHVDDALLARATGRALTKSERPEAREALCRWLLLREERAVAARPQRSHQLAA